MLVAVKPEYQGKGVNALLFTDLIPTYNKWGFTIAESNPELAENDKVQNQWESFEYRQHRSRRAFSKESIILSSGQNNRNGTKIPQLL